MSGKVSNNPNNLAVGNFIVITLFQSRRALLCGIFWSQMPPLNDFTPLAAVLVSFSLGTVCATVLILLRPAVSEVKLQDGLAGR